MTGIVRLSRPALAIAVMLMATTTYVHGTVAVCVLANRAAVMASDSKQTHNDRQFVGTTTKIFEFPDLLVAIAGLWRSDDGTVDPVAFLQASYKPEMPLDTVAATLEKEIAPSLGSLLTRRLKEVPEKLRQEIGDPQHHVLAFILCRNTATGGEMIMLEYFATIESDAVRIRTSTRRQTSTNDGYIQYFAIGDGAKSAALDDAQVVTLVRRGDLIGAVQHMIRQGIRSKPETCGPPITTWVIQSGMMRRVADAM